MTQVYKPGGFGLAVIAGKTGKLVSWGQDIVDGRKEKFTHAYFILDNDEVLEAEPGGAIISPLSKYTERPADQVLFCDRPVTDVVNFYRSKCSPDPGPDSLYEQIYRKMLVDYARKLEGIPYNYLDYVAIGLEHFKIDLPVIRNRVRRPDRMICSQLVDYVYSCNGIHLFDDGRLAQDVTPGDLETYANG